MESPFESKRLLYRALEPEDEGLILEIGKDYAQSMNAFAGIPKPISKATVKIIREYNDQQFLAVVICLRDASPNAPSVQNNSETTEHQNGSSIPMSTPIGFLTLRTGEALYAHHRSAMIGIQLFAPYRGQGYGTEAIEWTLQYGFDIAGLHRIGLDCFAWNEGACKLYARMGFVLESRQRKSLWYKGGWHDKLGFAMLDEEWRERRTLSQRDELDKQ